MKPQKHYKQVWIESEDDLPKVTGDYTCIIKDINQPAKLHFDINSKGKYGYSQQWMKLVDSYFKPSDQFYTKNPLLKIKGKWPGDESFEELIDESQKGNKIVSTTDDLTLSKIIIELKKQVNDALDRTANLKELVKAQKEYIYIIDNQLWLAKPSKYYDKYCQLRKRITELNNNLK